VHAWGGGTLAPGPDVVRGGGGSLQFNLSVAVDKTRAELATAIERAGSYMYIGIYIYYIVSSDLSGERVDSGSVGGGKWGGSV